MFPFTRTTPVGSRPPAQKTYGGTSLSDNAPALRNGAERVLASIVKSLQTMAGATTVVEGLVSGIRLEPMQDVVLSHRAEQVVATIGCEGRSCTLLATLDPMLVHAIVELLAGGNGSEPAPDMPRVATGIDQQYAQIVVTLAAAAIEAEWAANGFGKVRAAKLEGVAPDVLGPRVFQVGVITFSLGLFGLRGALRLALPAAAMEAFKGAAEPELEETAQMPDPIWSDKLRQELGRAPVKIEAYLSIQDLSLGAIADLKPGQMLAVRPGSHGRASLVCDGRTMYRGELGQDENRYALRIDDVVIETNRKAGAEPRARGHRRPDLARAS